MTVVLALSLLASGMSAAGAQTLQKAEACHALLTMESSGNETLNRVTVCSDGVLLASHSFTAPAFGSTPEKPTKWEYQGHLEHDELADLNNVLARKDIAALPSQVTVETDKSKYHLLWTLNVTINHDGKVQSADLRNLPYLVGCEMPPEINATERDLICLLTELYEQAKSGAKPEQDCNCQPLHAMAAGR